MKSHYNLPLEGQCDSHNCESVDIGRCNRIGKLYRLTSEVHEHINEIPWEEYSCDEAKQINYDRGFTSEEVTK